MAIENICCKVQIFVHNVAMSIDTNGRHILLCLSISNLINYLHSNSNKKGLNVIFNTTIVQHNEYWNLENYISHFIRFAR